MAAHSSLLVAAVSLLSTETQDVTPLTSPGGSRIRAEEPKPPVSEMFSWMILNKGDSSANVADSTDDPVALEHARNQGMASDPLPCDLGPLQHDYDKNQRDPIIDDTSHVDLTPQGTPRSPSPCPDPSGRKPVILDIPTDTQLGSRGGEVVDRKPFDSGVNMQAAYSESSSHSQNVAGGPGSEVVEVRQPVDERESKHQFPALQLPQSNPKTTEDKPRHRFRTSLTRLSTFGSSSPPFNESRRDAGSSRRISGANTSTVPGWKSGFLPKSKLSAADEGKGIQGSKKDHQKGKERDDHSHASASTDYVSVSNEVEEHPRGQDSIPVSSAQSTVIYDLERCFGPDTVAIP
jgi:hypothetical protein